MRARLAPSSAEATTTYWHQYKEADTVRFIIVAGACRHKRKRGFEHGDESGSSERCGAEWGRSGDFAHIHATVVRVVVKVGARSYHRSEIKSRCRYEVCCAAMTERARDDHARVSADVARFGNRVITSAHGGTRVASPILAIELSNLARQLSLTHMLAMLNQHFGIDAATGNSSTVYIPGGSHFPRRHTGRQRDEHNDSLSSSISSPFFAPRQTLR